MKSWDAIIVGGGIIGLTLAVSLHKRGLKTLVIERGEPGREASHAAGGMLAAGDIEPGSPLFHLARASASAYPEFVHEIEDASKIKVDLRDQGTIVLRPPEWQKAGAGALPRSFTELEAGLAAGNEDAIYLAERSLDPRLLVAEALGTLKHLSVDLVSGTEVTGVVREGESFTVKSQRADYHAAVIVNCAGAWAGQMMASVPVRPVKGQMLSLVGASGALRHVVRSPEAYLIPRSDGRVVIGATVEEAGYDKRTQPDTIKRLLDSAVRLVPTLSHGKMLDAWAGLRPGTPDDLPILGATRVPGSFIAAGHYRDGILLAPVTAQVMSALVMGEDPKFDLRPFSPERFLT